MSTYICIREYVVHKGIITEIDNKKESYKSRYTSTTEGEWIDGPTEASDSRYAQPTENPGKGWRHGDAGMFKIVHVPTNKIEIKSIYFTAPYIHNLDHQNN